MKVTVYTVHGMRVIGIFCLILDQPKVKDMMVLEVYSLGDVREIYPSRRYIFLTLKR